jgi:hypothetical protein
MLKNGKLNMRMAYLANVELLPFQKAYERFTKSSESKNSA